MLLEDKRQIGIFLLANIAAIYANGQSYAERTNLHTGIALEEEYDNDFLHTEYYEDNSHDGIDIWRWNVEEFPHPQLDSPSYCHRIVPGNICDPDAILTRDQVYTLDGIIQKLFNKTKCICDHCEPGEGGVQIGIALLRHTFQPYIEHSYKIIRSFTENLRSKWNLGKCDNDILIVVATDDRQFYTDVGPDIAQYISKKQAYDAFLQNKDYFSKGEYYDGLLNMLKSYEEITKDFAKNNDDSGINVALISGVVVIIVVILAVVILVLVFLYRRKLDKQSPKKKKTQKGVQRSSSWRDRSIKTIFSTFVSTNDAYQPCKVNDDHQGSLKPKVPPVDHIRNDDEEILNLELAEPDPKPIETHQTIKQTDYNENENKSSTNNGNGSSSTSHENQTSSTSRENQSSNDSKNSHQISNTYYTRPKFENIKVHRPVSFPNNNTFQTFKVGRLPQFNSSDVFQ